VTNRRQTERTRLSTTSLRYSRTGGLINTNDIVFAIDAELLRLLQGGLGPQIHPILQLRAIGG
jgi:hypothetical protein